MLELFPECVAKGSRFTFGGLGVDPCSRDPAFGVRNRPQPSATVRNRLQPSASVRLRPSWAQSCRAYGKSRKSATFWRVRSCDHVVLCGRRGTSWHSNMFQDVSKLVLCGRRNTFATFSDDVLRFSWQAQHFGYLRGHFAWQAQHFGRVVLRVFCESHCQRCAQWWQGANSVAGVAFCDMSWKSTEASHETSILTWQILRFTQKLVGKRWFLRYKVWKVEEVSYEMLVLSFRRV